MFLQRPATLSQAGDSLYTNRQNAPERGRSKIILDALSNSGAAVRLYGEGRATGPAGGVSAAIDYAKNSQIACRFPATLFDA